MWTRLDWYDCSFVIVYESCPVRCIRSDDVTDVDGLYSVLFYLGVLSFGQVVQLTMKKSSREVKFIYESFMWMEGN